MQAVMFAASLYREHGYDESTVELCKAAARERWEAEGEPWGPATVDDLYARPR